MKRIFAFFVFLSFVVFCISACSVSMPDISESTHNSQQPTIVPSQDEHADIPYVLFFESFDKIAELNDMVNRKDNDLTSYLDSNGYSMNGLSSEADVINLFKQISNLKLLHMSKNSGYELTGVSYYVSYGYIMSTYSKDDSIVRFICYLENGNNMLDSWDAVNKDPNTAVEHLTVSDKTIALYRISETNSLFALSGGLKTANSYISILISKEAVKSIRETGASLGITEYTLIDLISQK